MADEQVHPIIDLRLQVIAQRIFLEQFAASIFNTFGQSSEQFDGFADHMRSIVGLRDGGTQEERDQQEAMVPRLKEHLDAILAEVRRNIRT